MNILGVGNSYSDDSFEWLYPILKELGYKDSSVNNLYIPGCSIYTHAVNAKDNLPAYEFRQDISNSEINKNCLDNRLIDTLNLKKWDYISFQQYSGDSGRFETFNDLEYLLRYVRANVGEKAKFVWNMTWAYKQTTFHGAFANYDFDQMTMYKKIVDCSKRVLEEFEGIIDIIPTGTAIQNARTSEVGDNLTRDTFHLGYDFGRYVASLTWALKLTGKDIRQIKFAPDGVDDFRKRIAIKSAIEAVKNPYKVTEVSGLE